MSVFLMLRLRRSDEEPYNNPYVCPLYLPLDASCVPSSTFYLAVIRAAWIHSLTNLVNFV